MIKNITYLVLLSLTLNINAQESPKAFKGGEWLQYKMSYSGFLRAGTATLELKNETLKGKEVIHAIGKGRTSGMISWFFKVKDRYESYFTPENIKPYLFIRDIDEGGYKKRKNITFNYQDNTAYVEDFINKKDTVISVKSPQDMI